MNTYITSQFLEMESSIWDAMKSGNSEADSEILSDDFLGVYDDGYSGKCEHVDQLADGPIISSYVLTDAQLMVLSEKVVLLSYLAELTRINKQEIEETEKMYVSSVWRNENGIWKNVFSQDTPKKS